MKPQHLLVLLSFNLAAVAPAQLRINELLLKPYLGGPQIIELVNTSNQPFTAPANWRFCIRPTYLPIPAVQIPAGGVVRMHIGVAGTNTATDWYLSSPALTQLPLNGEFAIYSTNIYFTVPAYIEDFISWGTGVADQFYFSRIGVAINAGIWPDAISHVPLPEDEGSSLAWFGTGNGPAAYYEDFTPTLGGANEPASFSTFGSGCLAGAAVPVMDIVPGQLPWQDESFTLQISQLPPGALPYGVLGLSNTAYGPIPLPQDLAFLGFPGCIEYVSADFITPLPNAGGTASWNILIPSTVPGLIGFEFFTQAIVLFGAGEAAVSNAASGVIGGIR